MCEKWEELRKKSPLAEFFLHKNPYHRLHCHLHDDGHFIRLQKSLGLHMGLFALVDPSDENNLRYLYGRQNKSGDKDKIPPHFYLPSLKVSLDGSTPKFVIESPREFDKQSVALYSAQSRGSWRNLTFVSILNSDFDGLATARRTEFEKDHGVIYAPSGEVDSCVLCWLLLHLDKDLRIKLDAVLAGKGADPGNFPFEIKQEETGLSEETDIWRRDEEKPLVEWLYVLGLTKNGKKRPSKDCYRPTERGREMVKWLGLYLQSKPGAVYFLGEKENKFHCIIGENRDDIWLFKTPRKLQDEFLSAATRDPGSAAALIAAVRLLLNWTEPAKDPQGAPAIFQSRCRMTLYGHLVLRANPGSTEKPEQTARGWLVFPVCTDASPKGSRYPYEYVGFFLGTIRDNDAWSSEPGEHGRAEVLDARIAHIRDIITPLASVEIREIYFREMYRRHVENAARGDSLSKITSAFMHEMKGDLAKMISFTGTDDWSTLRDGVKAISESGENRTNRLSVHVERMEEMDKGFREAPNTLKSLSGRVNGFYILQRFLSGQDPIGSKEAIALNVILQTTLENYLREPVTRYQLADESSPGWNAKFLTWPMLIESALSVLLRNAFQHSHKNSKVCFFVESQGDSLVLSWRNEASAERARNAVQRLAEKTHGGTLFMKEIAKKLFASELKLEMNRTFVRTELSIKRNTQRTNDVFCEMKP